MHYDDGISDCYISLCSPGPGPSRRSERSPCRPADSAGRIGKSRYGSWSPSCGSSVRDITQAFQYTPICSRRPGFASAGPAPDRAPDRAESRPAARPRAGCHMEQNFQLRLRRHLGNARAHRARADYDHGIHASSLMENVVSGYFLFDPFLFFMQASCLPSFQSGRDGIAKFVKPYSMWLIYMASAGISKFFLNYLLDFIKCFISSWILSIFFSKSYKCL